MPFGSAFPVEASFQFFIRPLPQYSVTKMINFAFLLLRLWREIKAVAIKLAVASL